MKYLSKQIPSFALIILFWGVSQLYSAKSLNPPNIILIFIDDQGYHDLGAFGTTYIKTPNMDRMAAEGGIYKDFYASHNVCSPSRASILTGCYHKRVGNFGVLWPDGGSGLNPHEITIADLAKRRGYNTAAVGKWHLGDTEALLPTTNGFDSYYGIPYSNDMKLNKNHMVISDTIKLREGWTVNKMKNDGTVKNLVPLYRDLEIIEYPADQTTITKRYTDESIRFIHKNATEHRPFFLYLAHTMPHIPLFMTPEFENFNKTCDEVGDEEGCGKYANTISEIDFNVGRILDTLKTLGIDSNTLVVYTSDNGPWNLGKGQGGRGYPLSGYKFSNKEGGQRVPTVMWWPGTIPTGLEQEEVGATIDLLPTFAGIMGVEIETDEKIQGKDWIVDGVDILDIITGKPGAKRGVPFYYQGGAIREGDFKFRDGNLYNLANDIGENSPINNNDSKKNELKNKLSSFWNSISNRGAGQAGWTGSQLPVPGCTNPDAANFNANAGRDDGSCIIVRGCMDPAASNFETLAVQDDGSCEYNTLANLKNGIENDLIKIQNRSRKITISLAVPASVTIKSVTGQTMVNISGRSRTHTLSQNTLKPGVYVLQVEAKGTSLIEKFMVY